MKVLLILVLFFLSSFSFAFDTLHCTSVLLSLCLCLVKWDLVQVQMSYVIAATRPAGPVLLSALGIALLTPFVKKLVGIE